MSFHNIYIDAAVADSPLVHSICSRLGVPAKVVGGVKEVFRSIASANDPVLAGKQRLFLTQNRGAFIRDCPGTRHYRCCGYKILHIGTFCTLDCSYCILQSYFHPPLLQYFVNHKDLFTALNRLFSENRICRIGTGEFTDSMIWEPWTDVSQLLIPKFADQCRAVLELKTKTAAIHRLKGLHHNRKTIMAWSVNTPRVIRSEEQRTASLSERLKAAAKCESWGYPLAFHFDPMLIYDGCTTEYTAVVDEIFSHVSRQNIAWISMGTFRYMPLLKKMIQLRFPKSSIVYGEFIPGLDGKMRYFKPLRIELYREMVSRIREYAPETMLYLCMEDDEVWEKSLGYVPKERGGLPVMLDRSAKKLCGVDANGK